MNPVNLEEDPELQMRTAILANASFLPGEILRREPSYTVPGLWTWRDHNLMICAVLSHRFLIACYTEVESYYKYQTGNTLAQEVPVWHSSTCRSDVLPQGSWTFWLKQRSEMPLMK